MNTHSLNNPTNETYLISQSADCFARSVGKIVQRANRHNAAQTVVADCRHPSRSDAAALRAIGRSAELTRRDFVRQISR